MNKESMLLWTALSKLGKFGDSDYDKAILDDLRQELHIDKTADFVEEVYNCSPEMVLQAFFNVTAPLTDMYADILNLFETCSATQSSQNIDISFDSSRTKITKFNIDHFLHAKESLIGIRKKRRELLIKENSIESFESCLHDLLAYLFKNKNSCSYPPISNSNITKWLDEYYTNRDRWPTASPDFNSVLNGIEDDVGFQLLFSFWTDMYSFCKNACSNRGENYDIVWKNGNKSQLLQREINCFLGTSLEQIVLATERYREKPSYYKERVQQSINTFKNSIKYSEHETEDLFNSFKEFLRLPVWKHRYEVYSIWVFTRIIDGLTEADIKFNIRDNTLSFPFSGACLAEVSLGGKQYEVWTELRTAAIVHPTGRSRKKHIQPDYSIVCGDANSVSNSVLVIECKQYKKSDTSNFGHAIIDYAYNRPMAKVLLANYGVINEQSMSNALQNLPDERYGLFSFCRPNSDTARALSAEVRRILYRKSRLYKVNTSKNVIFTLFWDENQNCDHQDLDLHLLYTDTLTGVSSTLSYKEQNIDGAQYSGDVRCSPGTEQIIIQHFMPGYYDLWVNNYSSEIGFHEGNPVVTVSIPGEKESIALELPNADDNSWWHVLRIDATKNVLKVINQAEGTNETIIS